MKINYWVCKFHDYEETWDGETEERYYFCKSNKGDGCCVKNNKYGDAEDECKIAETLEKHESKP